MKTVDVIVLAFKELCNYFQVICLKFVFFTLYYYHIIMKFVSIMWVIYKKKSPLVLQKGGLEDVLVPTGSESSKHVSFTFHFKR